MEGMTAFEIDLPKKK